MAILQIRIAPTLALAILWIAAIGRADELAGRVEDGKENPVPGVAVRVEVGWIRYSLTPAFDHWYAVDSRDVKSGENGRFAVPDLPKGTVSTVFVTTGAAVGVARGAGDLTVRLGKPGAVRGKVTGKRQELKALRILAWGGHGLGFTETTVDKKTGAYSVTGLLPGEGEISVRLNNFEVASQAVEIKPGKTAKAKTVKYKGKFLTGMDPLVDCLKARLVDGEGSPVPAVQLSWSSRWMDGGMNSDPEGLVKLAGGGVAIGGPPYILHLATLTRENAAFGGTLEKVRGGIAIVRLDPLHLVRGRVLRGEDPIEHYRLFVVGPGESPRVYWASVTDGEYSIQLPAGNCRFVVGTVDAKLHTRGYEVVFSGEPQSHDIVLQGSGPDAVNR